jgi:phosphate transport system permease protein
MAKGSFTGRTRLRYTRWTVRLADRLARALITLGGIGTIAAISFVFVFLLWVVAPLFLPARMDAPKAIAPGAPGDGTVSFMAVDEYRLLTWSLDLAGRLRVRHLKDGRTIEARALVAGEAPTAIAVDARQGRVALGFRDGSIRLGGIAFSPKSVPPDAVPAALRALAVGDSAVADHSVLSRPASDQWVSQQVEVQLDPSIPGATRAPVLLIDQSFREGQPVVAVFAADGALSVMSVSSRTNLLTGEATIAVDKGRIDLSRFAAHGRPRFLQVSGVGDAVYLAWADGYLVRLDTREIETPKVAETANLVREQGATLTALGSLIGRATLISGDSRGRVRAWFRVKPHGADTPDGAVLVAGHDLGTEGAAVTALAPSARTRLLAAGYADGTVRLFHVTTDRLLAEVNSGAQAVQALALAPRDDALLLDAGGALQAWTVDARYPEAGLRALFAPVWYENYTAPTQVWQSSGATDDFEPKFGLMPLVFGTVKATVYCMLFGVPVALLAAIYTSEFLRAPARARIKPVIEMMASLPSVVLGFLAALVVAPFVEGSVPELLTAVVTVPLALLLGAHLWQLLPSRLNARLAHLRLPLALLCLPLGVAAAWLLGPWVEAALFAGNLKLWLDGQVGGAAGGWFFALLPLSGLFVAAALTRVLEPTVRGRAQQWTRARAAANLLLTFGGGVALAFALALAGAFLLALAGLDPRGGAVGTYVQRNAAVVGFIMGFAVIPIIYTLAEDALSSVPDHLRSGSLAAGATPWQTAVRIVIPTAMSGLFSAVMVGFGRAVGETMVVLMAAGNTPVMDWNPFNGFRTLSANIAVEMPEAVRNSTHYRILFLAALTLFVITFAVNTVAELVRQRFRKRAYQL